MENPKSLEYLTTEAEHVRKAYAERVQQTRVLERYSLLATGGIWSWCVMHPEIPGVSILLWMPAVITFLFGIRAWGNAKAIYATRMYLSEVEEYLGLPEEFGWGRHLKKNQEPRLALTAYLFWSILQLLTIFVPIFYN